ncbi:MAG: hypothetical protein E7484_02530 [Ruminococcaceae bacterium]|nr:hypothetical protein [Oscillospiraceae bacterium]
MIKTGRKKENLFYKIGKRIESVNEKLKEKWMILLCISSLFSSFTDLPLSFLSLVIVQTVKTHTAKYICALVSLIYFLTTVTQTAFYIPYITFMLIYIMADYLIANHSLKSVYPAVFTFAVVKGYLLSFGYDVTHWVLFAVELVMMVFMPSAAQAGYDILKNNDFCQSGENIFEVFAAFALAAFSLDGISVWGISFSAAFLFGAAVYYGIKYNYLLSLASLFVMVASLCQRDNFAFLTAGFAVAYLSAIFFVPKGIKGYIVHAVVTAAVTMLFITHFNSMEIFSASMAGLAGALYVEKFAKTAERPCSDDDILTGERDYILLKEKLEKLNRCFKFLGHTVTDISNLMIKDFVPISVEDAVSNEICRRCKNNVLCWQQNYSYTQSQFSAYALALQKNDIPVFESRFCDICGKTQQLHSSFESHHRLVSTQKLMNSQAKQNQKLLQNQFLAMADVLQEITVQSRKNGVANTAITHKANSFLMLMGKKVNYCICYQNHNRCIVSTREHFDTDECIKFRMKLEALYGSKFNMPSVGTDGENTVYTFSQVPMFSCEYGLLSVGRFSDCGDVCEYFSTDEWAYAILADGMGTGSFAAAESRTAAAMLKSLLTASVTIETALEITNTALNLKGTGQSCVAVDILQINLYNGGCNLYKAGGAATIVLSGDESRVLYKDSLPLGIFKETKVVQLSFILNNGDAVVLASDGVDTDANSVAKLKLAYDRCTTQQLAEYAVKKSSSNDDATAAVLKLIRT